MNQVYYSGYLFRSIEFFFFYKILPLASVIHSVRATFRIADKKGASALLWAIGSTCVHKVT